MGYFNIMGILLGANAEDLWFNPRRYCLDKTYTGFCYKCKYIRIRIIIIIILHCHPTVRELRSIVYLIKKVNYATLNISYSIIMNKTN